MDRYDEMAEEVWAQANVEALVQSDDRAYDIIAAALRQSAADAYRDAASICQEHYECECERETGGGHLSSISAGFSEACITLRDDITAKAAALDPEAK